MHIAPRPTNQLQPRVIFWTGPHSRRSKLSVSSELQELPHSLMTGILLAEVWERTVSLALVPTRPGGWMGTHLVYLKFEVISDKEPHIELHKQATSRPRWHSYSSTRVKHQNINQRQQWQEPLGSRPATGGLLSGQPPGVELHLLHQLWRNTHCYVLRIQYNPLPPAPTEGGVFEVLQQSTRPFGLLVCGVTHTKTRSLFLSLSLLGVNVLQGTETGLRVVKVTLRGRARESVREGAVSLPIT